MVARHRQSVAESDAEVQTHRQSNHNMISSFSAPFEGTPTNLRTAQPNADGLRRGQHRMEKLRAQYGRGREALHLCVGVG